MKASKNFVALFLSLISLLSLTSSINGSDPDEYLSLEQLVEKHGYALELHQVITKDGYHLLLHRIVNQKVNLSLPEHTLYELDRKPVILQHGLFGSSADFFISSPFLSTNKSEIGDNLAFDLHLTDKYDVWLPNSRGNKYSRGHEKYKEGDRAYWRFSFDQMATFDAPAVIDYIRNVTKKETIGYVGYSQGTALMFGLLSLQPEYAQIIRPFIALAPVTTVASIKSPIRYLAPLSSFFRLIGGEFLPSDHLVNQLSSLFCANKLEEKYLCENIVFLFSGFDAEHLNMTRIPVYFQFMPSSASSWDVAHWAQLVESERFARFDYGSAAENKKVYGQETVPDFPLENIPKNARIILMRAQNDYLSSIPDTERLIKVFKKSGVQFTDYIVPEPSWTHIDFAIGEGAGRLVYGKVIEMLDKYC